MEHIVDDHHRLPVDALLWKLRLPNDGPGPDGHQIVPIKGDVQASVRDLVPFGLLDLGFQERPQLHTPTVDAHEDQIDGPPVLFHQLSAN